MSEPIPTSGEFRVNTYTIDSQTFSSVAALADGGFVVTWSSFGQDGSISGIYGQRYGADGTPAGAEFKINSYGTSDQKFSSVAAMDDGGFVVTWSSNGQDGSGFGIYGQRYNADGTPAGTEFKINSFTTSNQQYSSVATLDDGSFVVTWESNGQDGSDLGIYGQRYNADGTPAGTEFKINSYTTSNQQYSSVATLDGGGFIVTWSSSGQDGSGYGIYGQRYNTDGTPAGTEFKINSHVTDHQLYSSVASLAGGGFVVTWSSSGQDGSGYGIYGQRYNADGTSTGTEFQVNSHETGDQLYSSVARLADGGFIVTWQSAGQDGGGLGIYGQVYNANGAKVGDEFRLSETVVGDQYTDSRPGSEQIVQLAGGALAAVWNGEPSLSGDEAYARLFELDTTVAAPGVALANDSGVAGDGQSNDATVNVTLAPDVASWEYRIDAGGWVTGSGTSFELPSADGTYTIDVRQTDDAGNLSAVTSATLELDTTIAAPGVALANDTGVAGDGQSNDATVNVTLAPDVASWEYQIDTGGWVTGSGTSFELPSADGTYTIDVRQTDDAGNLSAVASATFELDTTIAAPGVALANDSGVAGDDRTNDATVNLTLATDVASWEYRIDGGGWVTGSGTSFELPSADGTYTIDVRQTDDAGNLSAVASATFELDTTIAAPSITGFSDDSGSTDDTTYDSTPTLSIAAEAGSTVNVYLGGNPVAIGTATETSPGSGLYTFASAALAAGSYSFTATATDAAGNASAVSAGFAINIDFTGGSDADTIHGSDEADIIIGNEGADLLYGLAGNDTLNGGAGNDDMSGGAGDDLYIVAASGDVTTELAGEGADTVRSYINWTLGAEVEHLELKGSATNGTGNALTNTLLGNSLNNMLNGGAGNDYMHGGAGDDIYIVAAAGDITAEDAGQGTDTVYSYINWTLDAEVECLELKGSAANGTGNALNNTLLGNSLNNVLNGGAGNDYMRGGAGDDIYIVAAAGDIIAENAGQGIDTVHSYINWTLGAEVECLELKGSAANGTGNTLNNALFGNSLNNVLNGGAGNDYMRGGAGDDIYIVAAAGDTTAEDAGQGNDTVRAYINWTMGANVERLELLSSGNLNGVGNELDNTLVGNSGANSLNGGDGNDHITGGGGSDILIGGIGNDVFDFNLVSESLAGVPSRDSIDGGFSHGFDLIDLADIDANSFVDGDQAFSFIGSEAFSGVAGQLRYTNYSGNVLIDADINGDSVADMQILVAGTDFMTGTDFIV